MRANSKLFKMIAAAGLLLACLGVSSIDSVLKYSWGENIGWLNWRDANGTTQGVEHHGTYLSGYIWGENVGWINTGNGGPYANSNDTNYGVNVLLSNELTGYAWGENIGWINFFTPSAAPNNARWDPAAARFRGYAWGENVGWINLDDSSKYVGVIGTTITAWRSVRTHSGTPRSIVLNPTATGNGSNGPTVECRSGGIQRIEIDFGSPVTLATASQVTVTGRTTSLAGVLGPTITYGPISVTAVSATTISLNFAAPPDPSALPDRTCFNILLGSGLTNPVITGDLDVNVRSLTGDATSSGDVNLSDAILTQTKIGAAIATNVRYDMNLDGSITNADALFAKALVSSPARKALCP